MVMKNCVGPVLATSPVNVRLPNVWQFDLTFGFRPRCGHSGQCIWAAPRGALAPYTPSVPTPPSPRLPPRRHFLPLWWPERVKNGGGRRRGGRMVEFAIMTGRRGGAAETGCG